MNTDPIYEADGKISVRKAVPFGLQHVLAMFVANIAPILIVTGVVKVPASEAGVVVQAAMIIAGIGSLLQMYPVFLGLTTHYFITTGSGQELEILQTQEGQDILPDGSAVTLTVKAGRINVFRRATEETLIREEGL